MSLWSKIRGTIETAFQIGLNGPQWNNNSGNLEARNSGNSAFTIVRGASPVGDNDLTNKQYVDTITTRTVVAVQFNGNNALPTNSATEQFYVVTTSGSTANIGTLIWDDGSGSGNATILAAAPRSIITTVALTGGTISFAADSQYFWDTGSSSWINIGGTAVSGSLRVTRHAITNAASQSSTAVLPANAVVRSAMLDIVTPYSAGATITVGQTGTPALLMATTDNLATVAGQYESMQDTAWGASALAVLITVAGSPTAGAGYCVVHYTVPDA
jgi:hypothetical protein